ncbi:MAG: permease [Rhodospirillales bacterium]|nr:permease [Rhodospirillales bacterium]
MNPDNDELVKGREDRNLRPFIFFALLAMLSGFFCLGLKGEDVFVSVFHENLNFILIIAPRIAAAMLLAGFVQVLVPKNLVARWLGEKSGLKGLIISSFAGMVTPGGPMTSFPLVLALYSSGAERGALVAYMSAWSLLGVQRMIVWEIPLLGSDFTVIRFASCALLPILAGMLARRIPIQMEKHISTGSG